MKDDDWYPGMVAAQDQYRPDGAGWDIPPAPDAFEAAAARTRAPYAQAYQAAQERPTNINTLAKGLVNAGVQSVQTPGSLMAPNPYPPGSEEWQWYADNNAKVATEWAPQQAVNRVAAGTPFAQANALGSGGGKLVQPHLPMDETSRMARAAEQGFTRDAYRGEGVPIQGQEFRTGHPGRYDTGFLGGDAIYSTNQKHLANDYAMLKAAKEFDDGAQNVMPLKLKMDNPLVINADEKRRIAAMDRWDRDDWLRDVYAKGHDGVVVKYGDGNPARRSSSYEEYAAPAHQYRSRFAAFDPANKDKGHLLGGLAGLMAVPLGMGAIAAQDKYQQ